MELKCNIGNCGATMAPEKTFLPSLEVMGKKEGRRVKVDNLPRYAICERHARIAKSDGYKIFGYRGTVALIEQREQEKADVGKFFSIRGAMETAGITPPRKEKKKHRP